MGKAGFEPARRKMRDGFTVRFRRQFRSLALIFLIPFPNLVHKDSILYFFQAARLFLLISAGT